MLISLGPLDKVRSLMCDASNLLDSEEPENPSRVHMLKVLEISRAIDRVLNLIDSYESWAERELER